MADIALHKLREDDLSAWLRGLPETYRASSRQRLVNDLKAALNAAYAANRSKLSPAVAEVIRLGLKAAQLDDAEEVARDNQILSDGEVGRLLRFARQVDTEQGWSGDLYRLVVALAATGARFSQLVRMQVRDVQVEKRRLLVPTSRKGKGKKQSHTAVPVGADVLVALAPALVGRSGEEVLLERWRHAQAPGV